MFRQPYRRMSPANSMGRFSVYIRWNLRYLRSCTAIYLQVFSDICTTILRLSVSILENLCEKHKREPHLRDCQ